MRGTSLHNSHKYAKPLNSTVCRKSCSVSVYRVTMDDGELLIYEWERGFLKVIDGSMP